MHLVLLGVFMHNEESIQRERYMREFCQYFFGRGEAAEFTLLSAAHILPILLLLGVIALIYCLRNRIRSGKWEEKLRYAIAFTLIICDMSYYWRLSSAPWLSAGVIESLPIGVCGWSVILCSFMMIGKKQTLFDICYFWLLSGSLFALLTPTPITFTGPTRFRYYQFWVEHTMGYVAIFYMIFVHGMRPTVKSAFKSFGALVILAAVAYYVNTLIPGANYLYMARPEAAPSVLDILPANFALRLTIMTAAIAAMYALAYLPWYLKDRRAAK